MGLFVAIIHSILLLLFAVSSVLPIVLNISLSGVFIASLLFHRVGLTRLANLILPVGLWVYITAGTLLLQGYENPLIQSYVIIVLICGWLFGTQMAIISFVISVASILAIVLLQQNSVIPLTNVSFSTAYTWINVLANVTMLALIVGVLTTRVTEALGRSKDRAIELQEKLRKLHSVTIALNDSTSADDLFHQAIVLGRNQLGFDRLGLFLFDADSGMSIGTYGTDKSGAVRYEGDFIYPIAHDKRLSELLKSGNTFQLWDNVPLLEDWQDTGIIGWNIAATMRDRDSTIGWICTDNLLSQAPLTNTQVEIFRLYATTLAHLIVRKQAEENLKISQQQLNEKSNALQMVNRIAEVLQQERDIPSLAIKTLEQVKALMPYDFAAVYMVTDDKQHSELVQSDGVPQPLQDPLQSLTVEDSLSGRAIKNTIALTSHEIEHDERLYEPHREALVASDVKRVIDVPIVFANEAIGTISIAFYSDGAFHPEDITALQSIGKSAGMAFTNAQYVGEITQQKELSESIVESIPGIFMMLGSDYTLQRWNDNLLTILGYTESDVVGCDALNLFAENKRNELLAFLRLVEMNGRGTIQTQLQDKDGNTSPYIISANHYLIADKPAFVLSGIDVSERVQLLQRLQLRASQLVTAGDVSKSIVTFLDPDELLDFTVNLVCQRFEYYYVGVFLADNDYDFAILRAGSGEAGIQMLEANHKLKIGGQSMIGHCVETATPYIADDVDLIPDHYANPFLPHTRSEMALPLIHRETCIGAITVQSEISNAFSQEDISIMQFIADHLASALTNARLYDIIKRRQRYLGTLRRVSQRVTPELELKPFLQAVADALRDEFAYEIVAIFRADHDLRMLQGWAAAMDTPYTQMLDVEQYQQPFGNGIFGTVVRDNQSYLARSTLADAQYYPFNDDWDIASELAIPISHHENIIGVLTISSRTEYRLDELDLEMMQEFANELAIHIENIMLYSETRHNATKLERRVRERTQQLEVVNHELEAFAYSVSHDLRAPLRSVDGFSQALLEDYETELDDIGKDFLNRIRAGSQRMGHLIDDLLKLSRVTRRELSQQDVDLSQLAQLVIGELQEQQPRDNVTVKIEAYIRAQCDERLMQIVLGNLLGNAWKFTGTQDNALIEFGQSQRGEETIYFVKDNGVGFNKQYKNKLFTPFQRLHTQDEFEGTGIGLATVQRIIRKHGGAIWAESELGEGSQFFFTL